MILTPFRQYSIPIPKGGRKNNDLILREDSREYQKALLKCKSAANKKKKEDQFDPDYVPLEGWGRGGSSSIGPQIGHGRRNVNQVRRKKV